MEHPEGVAQGTEDLAKGLPVRAAAQRGVLAQWCFAVVERGLCAGHTVALCLRLTRGGAWQTVRQRVREW